MSDADRMRDKLRDLRRAGDHALEPELHSRLAEHLKVHGPAVVRRSRRRRAWLKAGTLLLPIALGAGWAAMHGLEGGFGGGTPERATEPALRASGGEVRACARPLDAPSFTALPSGRRWLDLGARARVVLDEGGEAELDATDPCHLELRLARGRVTVHAADLLGGEFRVRAAATDVVVHGTVFAVERTELDVSVEVDEGRVLVERTGRAVAPLVRGGERLRVDPLHAPVLLALTDSSRLQLRAALAEPPARQSAPRAEAARNDESGESTARSARSAVGTQPNQVSGDLEPQIARSETAGGRDERAPSPAGSTVDSSAQTSDESARINAVGSPRGASLAPSAAANAGRYRRTSTADLDPDGAARADAQRNRTRTNTQPTAASAAGGASSLTTEARTASRGLAQPPPGASPSSFGAANASATSRGAAMKRSGAPAPSRGLAQASDATRAADGSTPTRGAATAASAATRSSANVVQQPAGAIESGATTRSEANDSRSHSASDATSPANARNPASGQPSTAEPAPNAPGLGTAAREQTAGAPRPARESASTLLARADGLWRRGERDEARTLYQRAAADSGATAQAAWLALARRELSARDADAAREALASYTARFPNGALSEEAAGIEFRVALLDGDNTLAEKLARRLVDQHAGTAAAKAATRWLRARGASQ
jgi:hypothetical protein